MWIVKGRTISGKQVEYKVPAGKDTDKAFVMALAFQEHGKAAPDDALTAETEVIWTSDSVTLLNELSVFLNERANFAVEKRVKKGVYERFSARAYRSTEAAVEAMESAASEYPNDVFRIVETFTSTSVIAVSKNGYEIKDEEPDEEPKNGQTEIPVEEKETPKSKAAPKTKVA